MDPEEIPQPAQEPAPSPEPASRPQLIFSIVVALALIALLVYFGVVQGLFGIVIFIGIPVALLWFVYFFFLRRLMRMRRIRNAEQRRIWREAAMRNRKN